MQNSIFIVECEKIPRKSSYYIKFIYNEQLINRIKELPIDTRKWNNTIMAWEITTMSLYELMKKYKGSNKIYFDFGNENNRKIFIDLLNKEILNEKNKLKLVEELNKNKERWVKYKEYLEKNYVQYSERCHAVLNNDVKLYPHQIVAAMFMNETRNALISHEMGLGKCQDLDSKILTPNGWIRMGDIDVGDYVIGSDGKPKRVLGVYPQGIKDIYEIKFSDNTTARSCDEHLWNVRMFDDNSNTYLTKTLRSIINSEINDENGNYKWYIPIVSPIEFNSANLKINPYLYGFIIGNDNFIDGDRINIQKIKKRLEYLKKYELIDDINSIFEFKFDLNFKSIPDIYKFSSIQQRLNLLLGILDANVNTCINGDMIIKSSYKSFIYDIQFIVQSLGGVGIINDDIDDYKLMIILPEQYRNKINGCYNANGDLPNRAIIDISYWGKKESQCILVDSEDHLYVTDNCILTHNTLSSILFVEMNSFDRVIVITPNSLKFNYYNEVKKFTKSEAFIVNWKKNTCLISDAKYIIINYDFFNPSNSEKFLKKWNSLNIDKIDVVICDESQKLKNMNTNIYKNFKKIFGGSKKSNISKIFLSGTPAPNRAYELYSVLHEISPIDFPTKKHFYEYYCGMMYDFNNGWGYVVNTMEQKFEELYYKIAPYTHRKRKFEVLNDLPDKIYQKLIFELNDKEFKEYDDIENNVANDLNRYDTSNPLTKMIRLRQYTASLKINYIIDLIYDILDCGEKIVVVDVFKDTLYKLKNILGDISALHTGEQSVEERADVVNKFQDPNSDVKVFLGSIQTCNYGLTLTAASKLFIITLPYSVGEYDQVSDRLHRIGQKNVVNIYPLIFKNTIDDYVFTAIENKRKEIVKVMDNEDYNSNINESVVSEIIEIIKNKHKK